MVPKRTLLISPGPHFEPDCNEYKVEFIETVLAGKGGTVVLGADPAKPPVGDKFVVDEDLGLCSSGDATSSSYAREAKRL